MYQNVIFSFQWNANFQSTVQVYILDSWAKNDILKKKTLFFFVQTWHKPDSSIMWH